MPLDNKSPVTPDGSGIEVLLLMLRYHGVAADKQQLVHQYGAAMDVTGLLRCAKDMKLKARTIHSNWERLAKTPFPAIAERRDGGFSFWARLQMKRP